VSPPANPEKSQTNDTPFRGRALNGMQTFLYALDARPRNLLRRVWRSTIWLCPWLQRSRSFTCALRALAHERCLGLWFRMARRGWECDFIRMAFPFLRYYGPTLLQSYTISYLFRPEKQVRMSCAQGREQYQVFEKKQRAISNWQLAKPHQRCSVVTLCRFGIGFGSPKGHPWVTQGSPKRHARVSQATIGRKCFVCNESREKGVGGRWLALSARQTRMRMAQSKPSRNSLD
jgi:hypothetical protein